MFDRSMLESFFGIGKKAKPTGRLAARHVAITIQDNIFWEKENQKSPQDTFAQRDFIIRELVKQQVKLGLPVLTLYLLPYGRAEEDELASFSRLFTHMKNDILLHNNMVKVAVLGKWYDLPGDVVASVKGVINETKDYDRFFLNVCLNYSGHSEIANACRLIIRKISAKKISEDDVNEDTIKENLFSSYFLAPDLVICTGLQNRCTDLLLWDLPGAVMHFTMRPFNDLSAQEMSKILSDNFQKRM